MGLKRLVDYDAAGRPDGINYEKICLYLTEIAKRQQRIIDHSNAEKNAEIAALRTENRALAARVARLESMLHVSTLPEEDLK